MKIRNGFVSNSSSSSYIIKIYDTGFDEFASRLNELRYEFFNKGIIMKEIEERLAVNTKSINEMDGEGVSWRKDFANEAIIEFTGLKQELEGIEADDQINMLKFALKYHGIKVSEGQHRIELCEFTSMHNSFCEGMSDILKEIVLSFIFDSTKRVECDRESDND